MQLGVKAWPSPQQKVGDERKVKFWEDNWLDSSSLAIQYWEVYVLVQEQARTVVELWDGIDLKCTSRRGFNLRVYNVV
jgi:hypothetical protein